MMFGNARKILLVLIFLSTVLLSASSEETDQPDQELLSIAEKVIAVKPGKQTLSVTLKKAQAANAVQQVSCQWLLLKYDTPILQGLIAADFKSKDTAEAAIPIQIPDDIRDNNYVLKLQIDDIAGPTLGTQTIWLKPVTWASDFILRLRDQTFDKDWAIVANSNQVQFNHPLFSFDISSATTSWFLLSKEHNTRLITEGPFAWCKDKGAKDASLLHLLTEKRKIEKEEKDYQFSTVYTIENQNPAFVCRVDILISAYGFTDIRCSMPKEWNTKETGLSFIVPSTLSSIRLFGEKREMNTPDQAGQLGIHAFTLDMMAEPLYFQRTSLITIVNEQFNGLGIMMIEGAVLFERQNQDMRIILFPGQNKTKEIIFRLLPVSKEEPEILLKNFYGTENPSSGKE